MRELALVGLVALAFGVGAYYATDQLGWFGVANVVGGAVALLGAGVLAARRFPGFGAPESRRVLGPPTAILVVTLLAAVALERLASRLEPFDWTFERRYQLADATRELLAGLQGGVTATLFCDRFDPRCRSSRLLLEVFAESGPLVTAEQDLDEASEEADRFGISSSNTVVFARGERFQTVERPTEGAFYEALLRLDATPDRVLYLARGEGEGDFRRTDEMGYSGLASALETEGFRLRDLILASVSEIPSDASAVVLLAPERGVRDRTREALRRYLEGGGRLVAFLEPGTESGLEALLEEFGFALPDRLVIDPAAGPVEGDPPGVNPLVHVYEDHPVVRRLGPTRMTFLLRARPVFPGRKPRVDDRIRPVAYTSARAWLAPGADGARTRSVPPRPPDAREDHQPLVAVGRYPRGEREARIVVFGDGDFASNRYLRALFNMDLALNAIHWATQREARITVRPKGLAPNQFPLTPQETLRMLYGVGLLLPELLLLAGGLVWLRRRSA